MRSSPGGPGDHEGRLDPALLEACGHAADFLDRPAYQRCSRASSLLFWGDVRLLARSRTTAIMANASITSEPPRDSRRLQLLTGWSHDEENTPIFTRGPRTGGPDGVRSPGRVHLAV